MLHSEGGILAASKRRTSGQAQYSRSAGKACGHRGSKQSVWHACLVAPSAFNCLRAAFALSVVCLLKVATLTYASLPETSEGPTALLTEAHIWDVTGFSAMRCLVSFTTLDLSLLLTSRVTCE